MIRFCVLLPLLLFSCTLHFSVEDSILCLHFKSLSKLVELCDTATFYFIFSFFLHRMWKSIWWTSRMFSFVTVLFTFFIKTLNCLQYLFIFISITKYFPFNTHFFVKSSSWIYKFNFSAIVESWIICVKIKCCVLY